MGRHLTVWPLRTALFGAESEVSTSALSQSLLQQQVQSINFGQSFRICVPGIGRASLGGWKQAATHKQVFFNRQKPVESGLQLQGDQAADGKPNAVRGGIIAALECLPKCDDAIQQIHARHRSGNATAMAVDQQRLSNRRAMLDGIDTLRRDIDRKGLMEGLDSFEQQAFNLILSRSQQAFDLKFEDPRVVDRYGKGLGEQMLMARRLCEAGCGFVTINYGGWDMHSGIKQAMDQRGPEVDRAVAALVEDLDQRGMLDNVLLVISGEFGRTPKINGSGGRDHWAPLSTLALAGGGLRMGQVVGESAEKVDVPKTTPITPQDLMATIFHVLDFDRRVQFTNQSGRPTYRIETGKPIEEHV